MSPRRPATACRSVAYLCATLALASTPALSEAESLHVMLQGESAEAMSELVSAAGGTITHSLPVIDAVGATLDRQQLEGILGGEAVQRYIDDLAVNPDAEETEPKACDVGGALELDFGPQGFDWRLYNKLPQAAELTGLSLSWPKALGPLTSLAVAGTAVPAAQLQTQTPGALDLASLKAPLPLPGEAQALLSARFQQPVSGNAGALQSAIDVALSFTGGCE